MTDSPINVAHQLAPTPERDGSREDWVGHYAAQALAAYAEFKNALGTVHRNTEPGSRADLGHRAVLAATSVSAAVAINGSDNLPRELWDLDPDGGALNGEWESWLTETLDGLGVNPADIDPAYTAADFRSPSRAVAL